MESASPADAAASSLPAWDTVVATLLDSSQLRTSVLLGIAGIAGLLVLTSAIAPRVGSDEPPVLKPTIPMVGHIINILQHGTMMLPRYSKYNLPTATLPMLNGKMYVIWDTAITQGLFRKKAFSIEAFAANFAANLSGLDQAGHDLYKKTPITAEGIESFYRHLKGESLRKINIAAIRFIENRLNDQVTTNRDEGEGEWLEVPNVYLWLRETMTLASTGALWGSHQPMSTPERIEDLWLFESEALKMALNLWPWLTAPRAYAARKRVQAALGEYYKAGYDQDQDTSELIRERAAIFRTYDVTDEFIGKIELPVLIVSLTNTIPTLFWMFAHIFSTPGLADRLREEVRGVMRRDGDEATIETTKYEQQCPLLMSCYQEVLRVSNTATMTRQTSEDSTLVGSDGRQYFFKSGVDIQISAIAAHKNRAIWGPDVEEFDPDRFMCFVNEPGTQHVREKKSSFFPFGGGRHMCPGRFFALAEILTFVGILLLQYDVEPLDGGEWKKPPPKTSGTLAEATAKPVGNGEGFDVKMRRKAGWENVRWHFDV